MFDNFFESFEEIHIPSAVISVLLVLALLWGWRTDPLGTGAKMGWGVTVATLVLGLPLFYFIAWRKLEGD